MVNSSFDDELKAIRSALTNIELNLSALRARVAGLEDRHEETAAPVAVESRPTAPPSVAPQPLTPRPVTSSGGVVAPPGALPVLPTWASLGKSAPEPAPSVATGTRDGAPSRGVDMELRIGRVWLNRAGALVLFLAVAFFVKYAFEQGWLSPTTRVTLAGIFGLALVGVGEACFTRFLRTFAAGLLGCGVAVLYAAVYGAHGLYNLIDVNAAGSLYTLVTALAAGVAVHRRLLGVALLAVVGGFATPFFLNTGTNRQVALLTYIVLLDVGLLVCAAFRGWDVLRVLTRVGTILVFGLWAAQYYAFPAQTATAAFVLGFYLLFTGELLVALYRGAVQWPRVTAVLIRLDTALAIGALYFVLHETAFIPLGFIFLVGAAGQWLAAWQVCRPEGVSAPARQAFWHGGAVLLALVAPLLFDRYLVTVAWTIQAVVTFYFCRGVPSLWPRLKGLGVLACAVGHLLVFDLHDAELAQAVLQAESFPVTWAMLCFGFTAVGAYAASAVLTWRRVVSQDEVWLPALLVIVGCALIMGILAHHWARHAATWGWIVLALAWWGLGWRVRAANLVSLAVTVAAVCKFLTSDTLEAALGGSWSEVHGVILNRIVLSGLGTALLVAVVSRRAYVPPAWVDVGASPASLSAAGAAVILLLLVWTGTFEILRMFEFEPLRERFRNPAQSAQQIVSVFWSAAAVLALVLGIVRRHLVLRWAALVLFGVTVLKAFLIDLAHLEMVYRIVSFGVLGALLMAASLLYHNLAGRRRNSA
ncbi:MAG TPA: DUF2339 domain-containing protein [Phycisphaerae bacterium]|nr:DUF2339 domain-containing protein [Phycisphaerae bacterium]HNU43850.1 DUF2339 domain-containing protein [Phycisphaerae bacterium]